jgi:DNA-binding LacI/PurR family transcriptional regulator
MKELGVSAVTLQKAFDRLTQQGFLVSQGRRGTFVAEYPPDKACCALVFSDEPGRGGWNRYWSTMLREGKNWQDPNGRRFQPYFISDQSPNSKGHLRLCADAAEGGISGILFVNTPYYLEESPIFSSAIPRVCIGSPDLVGDHHRSAIHFLNGTRTAFDVFVKSGRHRLAAICNRVTADDWRHMAQEAKRSGLETRQEWWLGFSCNPASAVSARAVAHLLCSLPARDRPDCLLIDDDNLVPYATEGIRDAGLSIPRELEIIAYANFPEPTPSAVPCLRYGIDLQQVLGAALDEIDRQRGDPTPQCLHIAPVFRSA